MVKERAKGLIGHPNASWPPLAAETLKRKDGVNTPLLETGEMRDSIEHVVADSSHGYVGSNDDKAVWQELGTSRGIPPRSFLGLAAHLEGPNVAKVAGKTLVATIGAGLLADVSTSSSKSHTLRPRHSTRSARRRAMC